MSAPKMMAIRMGIYSLLIGYLLLDLFVIKGPLKKTLTEPQLDTEAALAEAKAQGVVARVYYEPIYRKQIEERMKEYLWRRGRTVEETGFSERKMLRQVILDEMVDELLVKIQVKVSPIGDFAVEPDDLEAAVSIEGLRLGEAYRELAARSGWQGEKELKMRLGARMQRENYLKTMLHAEVSEDEARAWFEEHQSGLVSPELRRVRYRIHTGETGGDGDPATVEWVAKSSLPAEFSDEIFQMSKGDKVLRPSAAGRYEIELVDVRPSRPRTFPEMKESIVDALTTYRRDEAWKKFRYERLRFRATGKIRIFEENLEELSPKA